MSARGDDRVGNCSGKLGRWMLHTSPPGLGSASPSLPTSGEGEPIYFFSRFALATAVRWIGRIASA